MRLKYAVVGGDRRAAVLCELLHADGHRVTSYALERAELPSEIPKASCLQGCVYGADCVVFPVPSERVGLLNAPYSSLELKFSELVPALWPGQLVFGGNFSDEFCISAGERGLFPHDLMKNSNFVTGNAAITAECALSLLINSSEKALYGSRVLITGWGRIAKHLAFRIAACGAELCIAARRPAHLAMIQSLGLDAVPLEALDAVAGDFDFIVNTIPARVISQTALCCAECGGVIMELASPPGGFDRAMAENIGLKVIFAPGLPGKYAPYSSAALIRDAVYDTICGMEDRI